ncbi:hypothetical protein BJV82DRAFT_602296 [Fennellomyces sp. T-0311]|nr:hypothetical protein BJV82DRAFT_602296 [Fennellomyces sp. T-0311]
MFTPSGYYTTTMPLVPALRDPAQLFLFNQEIGGVDSLQTDTSSVVARTRNLSVSSVAGFNSSTIVPPTAAKNIQFTHVDYYPDAEQQYEAAHGQQAAAATSTTMSDQSTLGIYPSQPIFPEFDEDQLNHFQEISAAIASPTYSSIDGSSLVQCPPPLVSPSTSTDTKSVMDQDTMSSPYTPFQKSLVDHNLDNVGSFGLSPFQQHYSLMPKVDTYQTSVNNHVDTSRDMSVNKVAPMDKNLGSYHRGTTITSPLMKIRASEDSGRPPYHHKQQLEKNRICWICGKKCSRPRDVTRHIDTCHQKSKVHKCNLCNKTFKRKDCVSRHLRKNCAFNREQQQYM